jgi:hypothetical protein
MRIISTRTHGVIDHLTGLLLIAAPWLFGFANGARRSGCRSSSGSPSSA